MRAFVLFQWKGNKQGKEKEQQWRETQRASEARAFLFPSLVSFRCVGNEERKRRAFHLPSSFHFIFNTTLHLHFLFSQLIFNGVKRKREINWGEKRDEWLIYGIVLFKLNGVPSVTRFNLKEHTAARRGFGWYLMVWSQSYSRYLLYLSLRYSYNPIYGNYCT